MRVLIIGAGYVGLPLGAELVRQGHEVWGLRRTPEGEADLLAAGLKPVVGDVTVPGNLASLPGPFDWVVNTVASNKGGLDEYRQVYLEGTHNLLAWLDSCPPKKYLHTSSTSVYAQVDGSPVKETSPTEPTSETSRVLVETEQLLLAAYQATRFPTVILRVAGIYGPERGHLFLQYLKNEARIQGKGERFINMIHRDDLVNIMILALKCGRAGEIYNAVDDEPVTQLNFLRWLSETLGKWMPPHATQEENAARKRGLTNKKVLNRKLKMELGYPFKHPNFRHGYTAEIQRLEGEGRLNIQPEPRDHLTADS